MRRAIIRDLLTSTLAAGATLASLPLQAQTRDSASGDHSAAASVPASAQEASGADIVVTGSRVAQPNLTAASPVTVVNAQEFKLEGAARVEDVVNSLPQSFAVQSSAQSGNSSGIATVNLRNLGEQRTLVLVNGRRLLPGDPGTSAADVNIIPASLIKRVDVLTGGASSVYGSDAIAGVVNFVIDTDFKGVGIDTNYSLFNHNNDSKRFQNIVSSYGYPVPSGLTGDGGQFDVTLKIGAGTDDGRGHLVAYAGYRETKAILQADRDYSACAVDTPEDNIGADYICGGSSTAFPANFTLSDARSDGPPTAYTLNSAGQLVPGTSLYNYNPLNYLQRPDKRYTAGFFAHYDINDAVKPYAEFMFMDDRTLAQVAPSGLYDNTTTINCNNPLLSPAQVAAFCRATNLVSDDEGNALVFRNPDGTTYNRANVSIARRNIEGEGRAADFRHTTYRATAGVKGDIASGISYDAYGQFATTLLNEVYRNELSIRKATRAIDVIRGANGQPVCRSVVDGSDPACIPYNIFGVTPVTPEARAYVESNGFSQGNTKETIVSGSITFLGKDYGIKLPWTDNGIALNVGAEYRKESIALEFDQEFLTGDLTAQGGPEVPISGQYNVKEVFGELQVPIASGKPFVEELSLGGGFRYSKYSTSGSVSSYKGELVWAPIADLRFRGGYNRAVRAPNVQELFLGQSVQGGEADSDPCAGSVGADGTVNGNTAAQCARTGVTARQFGLITENPAGEYNGLVGGNPALKPEKADTFTAGVIIQPHFLRGFNATVDAFRIKLQNIIGTVGADTTVTQCLLTGAPELCSAIHRGPNGTLWQSPSGYISDINVNAGSLKTQGIDVSLSYNLQTRNLGRFNLALNGTYVDKLTFAKVGAAFECAGLYGSQCGYPQSKWRQTTRLTWTSPSGLSISGRWRYFSAVRFEATSSDVDLAGDFFEPDARIGARSFFDMTLSAQIAKHYTFRVGANNIFDKSPPILSQSGAPSDSYGNGNTYPGVYDASGRYVFAGVSLSF